MRIGVVATGGPLPEEAVKPVLAIAAEVDPSIELVFHPLCFAAHGHFAGSDRQRGDAFIEFANDSAYDAIWFARGGYGTCRIAEDVLARLGEAARTKSYLGYSDSGYLFAGLYKAGFTSLFHGPMPGDVLKNGREPVERALRWLCHREPSGLEPSLAGTPAAAFNMIVFGQLLGTPLEPDLSGHVLMLEEVGEHLYRIDRTLFHITSQASMKRLAGLRLGRCAPIPHNEPPFGQDEEQVARFWCERSGIPFLGRADIGHDGANKVVPFGLAA
jgi:muramoyltetrapeptide carboxypeptidase